MEKRPAHGYIHGTSAAEQERLAALNSLTNDAFVGFLSAATGERVLEVGSGLGMLAAQVAQSGDRVRVVGVEASADQLRAARAGDGVTSIRADGHRLPFADESFDLVYARYLLEHVKDSLRVISEMRRVTRPGGRIVSLENDISLVRVDPPCPIFETVLAAFIEHQRQLGGDALIGRKLFRLFRQAGLSCIELSVQPEVHWFGSPGFRAWVVNLIGNIQGVRENLADFGCDAAMVDRAMEELWNLCANHDASATFVWNRAVGRR